LIACKHCTQCVLARHLSTPPHPAATVVVVAVVANDVSAPVTADRDATMARMHTAARADGVVTNRADFDPCVRCRGREESTDACSAAKQWSRLSGCSARVCDDHSAHVVLHCSMLLRSPALATAPCSAVQSSAALRSLRLGEAVPMAWLLDWLVRRFNRSRAESLTSTRVSAKSDFSWTFLSPRVRRTLQLHARKIQILIGFRMRCMGL